jgi:2-dehydropantoate 2-reductase
VRVLVFGAGAVGSFFGAVLSTRHEVTLVGRSPHVEAIQQGGLLVEGRTRLHVHPRAVTDLAGVEPPDVVILTVKSYDTASAVEALRPFWRPSSFLSLQNGLGNVELLADRAAQVLGGVSYHGVTFLGPGSVRHAGAGDIWIGPFRGASPEDAERVAAAFRESGLAASVTESIAAFLWEKAVVNACFNPLTGLLHAYSGALGASDSLMECCAMVIGEAVAVARALGVTLDPDRLIERVRGVSSATARNRSSMLQDMTKGRRTEIEAINGAIHRMGADRGIECPVNQVLTLLVAASGELASSSWRVEV